MIQKIKEKLFYDEQTGRTVDFAQGNHVEVKERNGSISKYGVETAISADKQVGYLVSVPRAKSADAELMLQISQQFGF